MSTRIFVYGTLQPGQPRWPILAPFAARPGHDAAASVPGRLFDTGCGWPAAVFDAHVGDQVPGVVVTLMPESIEEALFILDAVEGVASGLFRRIPVGVDGQPCWAYHWPGSTDDFRRVAHWPY